MFAPGTAHFDGGFAAAAGVAGAGAGTGEGAAAAAPALDGFGNSAEPAAADVGLAMSVGAAAAAGEGSVAAVWALLLLPTWCKPAAIPADEESVGFGRKPAKEDDADVAACPVAAAACTADDDVTPGTGNFEGVCGVDGFGRDVLCGAAATEVAAAWSSREDEGVCSEA